MKKIPKKYANITFSFLLAAMMSFFMSCFVTFRNIGFAEDFFTRWMMARWGAFIVGFLININVVPVVRKAIAHIVEE